MIACSLRSYALVLINIAILIFLLTSCGSVPKQSDSVALPEPNVAEPAKTQAAVQPTAQNETNEPQPPVRIKPSAPRQYTVVKGDTLWDISSKFLLDPWYWPEIWHVNPQIENPHLIYPGDVLTLFYVHGRPYVQVSGGPRTTVGDNRNEQKISRLAPKIRAEALNTDNHLLPVQAIQQFIFRPRVVTKEQLEQAPYIVGSQDNRLIYGAGDIVYIRGLERYAGNNRYSVFRAGKVFRDPLTDELLGYEALPVGDASLIKEGDTSTVRLTRTEREALLGDRLLPFDERDEDRTFAPRAPSRPVNGQVISLSDAISQIGAYQIAVLNLGHRNGIEKGHVLAVFESGRAVTDPFAKNRLARKVTLPDEKTGIVMVFRTFENVSYALVMEAARPVRVGNAVRNP
jgi:hypothetical protein